MPSRAIIWYTNYDPYNNNDSLFKENNVEMKRTTL